MSQKKRKQNKKTSKKKKVVKSLINPFSKLDWTLAGIILGLSFLVYANTIGHDFALDDNSVLVDSHIVRGGVKNIGTIFQTRYRQGTFGDASTTYRPVSIAMFATEWSISPETPSIHHFFNVLFYAMACGLLFLTFRRILKDYSSWIPFIATVVFAVHPVHTEVVANIKSRDEIMVFFFGILSLYLIWKYIQDESQKKFWGFSLLAYALALFSKENAVNFFILIPMTIYFFSKLPMDRLLPIAGSFLVPTLIFIGIRASILGSATGIESEIHLIDNFLMGADGIVQEKATAMLVMGKYLLLLLFPYPLICDYNYNYIPVTNAMDWRVILSVILHVGMLAYALMNFKKKTLLSFAILFYLVNMALYCNLFIVIGAGMGERFLFISSFGFCLALAYGLSYFLGGVEQTENTELNDFFSKKPALIGILAVVTLVFSYLTFDRNRDWYDSYSLYEADLPKAPTSSRLHGYMGTEFMKRGKDATDETVKNEYYDKAIEVYKKAVEIHPGYTEAIGQLGLGYFRKNDRATAAQYYERAIQDPQCKGSIYSNYGTMHFMEYQRLYSEGRVNEARERLNVAKELFEKGVKRQANYSDGWMNLGSTYGSLGNHAKAIECFKTALTYDPVNKAQLNYFIGTAYKNLGQSQKSREFIQKAARLDSEYAKYLK